MLPSFESKGFLARWIAVNVFWTALTAAAFLQGWVQYIFEKDITYISYGTVAAQQLDHVEPVVEVGIIPAGIGDQGVEGPLG